MRSIVKLLATTFALLASLGCGQAVAANSSELFVQEVSRGQIEKVGKHEFQLSLKPASGHTMAFTDRPGRRGRTLSNASFVSNWGRYGFKQDPPNAALSIDGNSKRRDVFLLTLKSPRIRHGRLIYRATALKGDPGYGLKRFESKADHARALHFRAASLFIDPTDAATQVTLQVSNVNPGVQSQVVITLNATNDLVWSTTPAAANQTGLQISMPAGQSLPLANFVLSPQVLEFTGSGASQTSTSFTASLWVLGSSSILEASANVGDGWVVNATINGVTSTWTTGSIEALLD